MKFKSAHISVKNGRDGYGLHRDGDVTWKTTTSLQGVTNCFDVITHPTIAAAKRVLGVITQAS